MTLHYLTRMIFNPDPSDAVALLSMCPAYRATPLRPLDHPGVPSLRVKDETGRMGLGSFKALGGVYAVADLVRTRTGTSDLTSDAARAGAAGLVVCCASAGNHGLAIAAGANVFGARAIIYLADIVPEAFAGRLRDKGATVVRAGVIYEDAMAQAIRDAETNGWLLVLDSSWDGYRVIPSTIMRGYYVMSQEMADTFRDEGGWPTHVFLQAGVGGLAAAVAAHIRARWDEQPYITIVEPDRAACLRASVKAGQPSRADGAVSNMGRLDCKEPSLVAFEILRDVADTFVTVTDEEANAAVATLEAHGVASTPSGVAGFASALQADLSPDARVLVIVSEGRE